jgi:enoyl-CoA hydratase/carnithine racemase
VYQELRYEVEDPVATITFDRPDRLNAMTNRMTDELKHAVAQAEADERALAIVITGAGRGFCAGADLQGLKAIGEGRGYGEGANLAASPGDPDMGSNFAGPYAYLFSVRKPVIAAVNGPCAGLGFAVMCFADLRFASDRAVFSTAFSRRGLIAEWGIGWTLPRLVGHSVALDLLFSARRIDAAEAERVGLVNKTLPHDELLPFVRAYVKDLADNVSPTSMAVIKRQVYTRLEAELGPSLEESIRLMSESFRRPDFPEGVSSYLEKRPPKFPRIKLGVGV